MTNYINSTSQYTPKMAKDAATRADIKVTIVVPVYNADSYLKRCILSIVNQTHSNVEIILINDGSIDNSLNICLEQAINDQRIKVITQRNLGVSAARNNGINNATGKYITFVDSDDYLELDAIDVMLRIMQDKNVEILRTSCNIVSGNRSTILRDSIKQGIYLDSEIKSLAYDVAIWNMMSYSVLLMIKKQFLNDFNIKFLEEISMMEDICFIMDLFRNATSVYVSNEITYNYVINPNGATNSIDNFENKINSIIKVSSYITDNPLIIKERSYVNAVYVSAVAGRVLAKSYNASMTQVRIMLDIVSKNKSFFTLYNSANIKKLSFPRKIAIWSVIGNRLLATQILRLMRKVSSI